MRCEICNSTYGLQTHHCFPQTKLNRKLYGDLLDDGRNTQVLCQNCHVSHRSSKILIWDEIDFCVALGLEPRSKTGKLLWTRING